MADATFCARCGKLIELVQGDEADKTSSDFVTLSCPACGGKLEITSETDRYTCKFCGVEHLVKLTGKQVTLAPVMEGLKRVESKFDQVLSGSDHMAAEQTIQRLKAEMTDLEKQIAEKEAKIKTIIPRESLFRLAGGLVPIGSIILAFFFFILLAVKLAMFADFPKIENFLKPDVILGKWVIWVPVGAAILILASLLKRLSMAKRSVRVNLTNPNLYEKDVQEMTGELNALKTSLEERKQQLEKLHRYTVAR